MKTRHKQIWGAVGAGLLVLVVAGWLLAPSKPDKNVSYRFLQCPNCGLEMAYNSSQAFKPCPKCGLKTGTRLVPSNQSLAQGSRPMSPRSRWIAFGTVATVDVLAVSWFVLSMLKRPAKVERPPEEFAHFFCPECKRKLRYPIDRGGKPGQCPNCHQIITFPTATQPA